MKTSIALSVCLLVFAGAQAYAQSTYGSGVKVTVSYVAPGTIHLDSLGSEAAWKNAPTFNLTKYWNGSYSNHPTVDVTHTAKVLWTQDTLYVYTYFQGYLPFYWGTAGNPWQGNQVLIGLDGTFADDTTVDAGYAGWPQNAPDHGATTYKIWKGGITLNWGVNASDTGFAFVADSIDTTNFIWKTVSAIYLPQAAPGNEIGFNIGGASADSGYASGNGGDGAYAYYSWSVVDSSNPGTAGGDVMNNAASFGILSLANGPTYGATGEGATAYIPYVAPGTISIGNLGAETAWTKAPSFNLTKYWNGSYSNHPTVDVTHTAKVLWTQDTLYVYTDFQGYLPFYWGTAGNPWQGNQVLIGLDGTHAEDTSIDNGYAGWPQNAPDKGPVTYKVWKGGITLNWGVNASDTGFAFVAESIDTTNFIWKTVSAIYLPQAVLNNEIGFNIGGAAADSGYASGNGGDGAYAYYSWSVVDSSSPGTAGGDVMNNAKSFGLIHFTLNGTPTAVREPNVTNVPPSNFKLSQNYPNPFNPSTVLDYSVPRSAHITITIYNILGQKVATLVNADRAPGHYSVVWEAAQFSSGVYLYQLSADGRTIATNKMILLK